MKRILISIGLSGVVLTSSCEKANLLLKEKERVEAEFQQGQQTLRELDAKFHALGADASTAVAVMERQFADWTQKNVLLEQQLSYVSSKCSEGEEALKQLRPRLEAYKTKTAR